MSSLDDEIEERFELGVTETRGRSRPSLCQEEQKLVEILRRYITKGSVAKQGFQIPEQMAIAFPGLASRAILLVIFKHLNCLS
jgi:hypothetical protein